MEKGVNEDWPAGGKEALIVGEAASCQGQANWGIMTRGEELLWSFSDRVLVEIFIVFWSLACSKLGPS